MSVHSSHTRFSSVPDAFREITSARPTGIAVSSGERELSYPELDERSDAFADQLIDRGVAVGDRIGIYPESRLELAIALLGILKAGASYVPLDKAYPVERLRFIVGDTGLTLIIGAPAPEIAEGVETIPFSSLSETAVAERQRPELHPDIPAYILYTSGSTGTPKGVVVPHRAILRLVIDCKFAHLGAGEKILQHSPIAFDASTFEIWGALLTGAEMSILPEGEFSLRSLGETIRNAGITTAWLTAGLFHAFVDERPEDLGSLRQLLTGGDVVSPKRAGAILERFPDLRLINGYGPTENTTFTCCHDISLRDTSPGPIPIGKAIAGTTVYIVDEGLDRVATGVVGELCAAGDGLALEYLDRPDLTAEKFVTAPWDETLRLYRTGDRARIDEKGIVHFEGREDFQVKVRGYRIELSEIESALESHSGIVEAVVLAEETGDQADKRLLAFYRREGRAISESQLRSYLGDHLPHYGIPAALQRLEAFPLSANGKVDRGALLSLLEPQGARASGSIIETTFADLLGVAAVPTQTNFFDLGLSSLHIARAHEQLERQLEKTFSITAFFEHTTIDSLTRFLEADPAEQVVTTATRGETADAAIAIVGMAGRFPGARDVAEFWDNLVAGRETISHFSKEELDYENAIRGGEEETFVRSRGIVDDSDRFDAKHFGIPPREAELLDPQHRLLLECAQHVLEDAGHDPDRFLGKIGIFSGSSQNSYLLNNLCSDRNFAQKLAAGYPVNDFGILFGNDKDFLPTRIAYKLNLRGPAMAVQCACSTSLVAVAQACESLRSGTSDMALAGGVSLTFPQKRDYLYTPEGMASSDGHCRAFDAGATGTVFGEGVGLVALRRLDDAIADGDEVVAVIRGFAINNDGANKAGYAAPSVTGQVEMIREAHRNAGVEARSIGYLEAHGTGTPLGDPIELAALKEAFASSTGDLGFCGLGTAKTNVGHLDIAAGVTGLIKAALTVKHGTIPPLVHYQKPNPAIEFSKSAFYPVTEATDWPESDQPRRAGVSALGVGGTNAHLVLEEAPHRDAENEGETGLRFYPVSASSEKALIESVAQLAALSSESLTSRDVAFSLKEGRREFSHRAVIPANTLEQFTSRSREWDGPGIKASPSFHDLAFLFPGQGAQHPGMAREIYENESVFRATLDHCAETLHPELGLDLREVLFPAPDEEAEMAETLRNTSLAQPAIFAVSYALACQWKEWGIEPAYLVGHSIGEFAAACFAGVFELDEALHLIARRGKLMSDLPGGVMISVRATSEEVKPFLAGDFDLAAVNGPKALVLAGPQESADRLERALEEAGLIAKRLHTSHAFHSRMMDPIVDVFAKEIRKLKLAAPDRQIFSTVKGDWMKPEDATDPEYWASHLRKPVQLLTALETLWTRPEVGFLEVGPGNTLATLAGQNPRRGNRQPSLSSLPHPSQTGSSHRHLLDTIGKLWCHGYSVPWSRIEVEDSSQPARVSLPAYPFQRERFWIEPKVGSEEFAPVATPVETEEVVAEAETPEDRVTAIFSELSGLSHEEIPADVTFLELGLDSLLLTQASREIQEVFGKKVTLRELIDSFGTVSALSAHLGEGPAPAPVSTAVKAAAPTPTKTPVSAPILTLDTKRRSEITPRQRRHIDDLTDRYTRRTGKSKSLTAQYRQWHADPRTASGFNREWKEMVYQIVTEKSKGSRLLDVDGNEYIDILNGFGPGFLGHSPDFVTDAIKDQLATGFEVGPNRVIAMETAELFCKVTGNERTSFVNTGSEAVQAAMRLARTVTGRDKIVIFTRDYHGNFDEVLVRGVSGRDGLKSMPVAPGIPKRAVEHMIVLPYGTDESLAVIREQAHELAAVIVEPVQSRRPEFRPTEFIQTVREITRTAGALFVFDEVVTGFRFGPGGAQDYYGVDADLATYGKVVGGGLPIGVVSGKAEFMDTFDGGMWQYGDKSFPEKPVTFFAGTFVRHPLAMASTRAMLQFFAKQPLHFWQSVNAKGDRLAGAVDTFFREEELPYEMPNRGSLMFVRALDSEPHANLLFFHLRAKGVFLLEGFPSYLTASHSDEDIDYVIDAFKESASEMQDAGFFGKNAVQRISEERMSGPAPILSTGRTPEPPTMGDAFRVPTTAPQREIAVASSMSDAASCAFNESVSFTFRGDLDREALRKSLEILTQRHDSLRATFTDDALEMIIHPEARLDYREVLCESAASFADLLRSEASTPFDLVTGPVLRARLVDRGDRETVLVLTAHHVVCDGWSYNVISEELCDLYKAQQSDSTMRIAEAKSFADYAREQERSGESKVARDYWIAEFETIPEPIELPLDRTYPEERSFSGGTVSRRVEKELYLAVKQAGAKQGCTLYATLGSIYAALLHRLTGQDELVYCIPAAGQNDSPNSSNLVGHCVHFLPLRSRLDPDASASEFLKQTRDKLLAGTDHRSFSYGELIEQLRISRDPRRMPLGEVAFNVERMDYFGEWPGLEVAFEPNAKTHVHYSLFLNIVESDYGLQLDVDFNGDVLDRDTVAQWLEYYCELMRAFAEDTSAIVGEMPLLSSAGRERIVREWSGRERATDPPIQSILHYFDEQVRRRPGETALEEADRAWTYRELDENARRVSAHLQSAGVCHRDRVGLVAERSLELVGALLGILRCGAAYVPVDSSYPEQRIHEMIDDCDPVLTIIDRVTEEANPGLVKGRTLLLEDLQNHSGSEPAPVAISKEDPAYVIYTSGSTGKPKGTVIPHRGVTRLVKGTDYISFSADQVFLLSAPISFDASTLELWGPLLNGAKLGILPAGTPGLIDYGNAIKRHRVTTLWLTAGLFQLMVEERPDDLRSLRQLLAGGDVISKKHAAIALDLLGETGALFNGYGPTENTTFTTCHRITREDVAGDTIPIGRAIPGTTVYLLDDDLEPVPPGMRGRLFTGGAGVSTGYLNRPDLTSERFIDDPFSDDPNGKLYDTGDLCRWRSDGTIEFLGRADAQVKIRGFRIEPGEVESVLTTFPGVHQTLTNIRGVGVEEKSLVAYLIPSPGASIDPDQVEAFAKSKLPHYLVPSRVSIVEKIPMTKNGKIDYATLEEASLPFTKAVSSRDLSEAPRTSVEKRIAAIWSEILGVESIGLHDDFFHLGGHSLFGLKLFTRLQEEFDIELPLATLFQAPTISLLSARIESDNPDDTRKETPLLTRIAEGDADHPPLFLVHGGDGGTLFYKGLSDRIRFPGDVYTIESPLLIERNSEVGRITFHETVDRYLGEVVQVTGRGSCLLGGYSFGGAVAFEMASRLTNAGIEVEKLLLFDTPNPDREDEFRNGLLGRVASNWQSNDAGFLGKVAGIGGRLGTGIASKIAHLNKVSEFKRSSDSLLDLPERLRVLGIQEDHKRQLEQHRPAHYIGETVLFRAETQTDGFSFNREMGWDSLTEMIDVIDVPGDHQIIFDEPHVSTLAARVDEVLSGRALPILPS